MLISAEPGTRRPPTVTLLAWCAAASLGLLFLKANSLIAYTTARYQGPLSPGVVAYLPLAAAAVALVVWLAALALILLTAPRWRTMPDG